VNENQGAESTLAFLMAQVEMHLMAEIHNLTSISCSSNQRKNDIKDEVTADVL
jgi:hypothetical protein